MLFFNEQMESADVKGQKLDGVVSAVTEAMIYAELSALPEEERQAYVESAEAEALCERSVLNKKTLVRLSKQDDLARRVKIAAYQLAKEKNDPLWTKLVKNRVMERALIQKIVQKYQNAAVRVARKSQMEYVKVAKSSKAIGKHAAAK